MPQHLSEAPREDPGPEPPFFFTPMVTRRPIRLRRDSPVRTKISWNKRRCNQFNSEKDDIATTRRTAGWIRPPEGPRDHEDTARPRTQSLRRKVMIENPFGLEEGTSTRQPETGTGGPCRYFPPVPPFLFFQSFFRGKKNRSQRSSVPGRPVPDPCVQTPPVSPLGPWTWGSRAHRFPRAAKPLWGLALLTCSPHSSDGMSMEGWKPPSTSWADLEPPHPAQYNIRLRYTMNCRPARGPQSCLPVGSSSLHPCLGLPRGRGIRTARHHGSSKEQNGCSDFSRGGRDRVPVSGKPPGSNPPFSFGTWPRRRRRRRWCTNIVSVDGHQGGHGMSRGGPPTSRLPFSGLAHRLLSENCEGDSGSRAMGGGDSTVSSPARETRSLTCRPAPV